MVLLSSEKRPASIKDLHGPPRQCRSKQRSVQAPQAPLFRTDAEHNKKYSLSILVRQQRCILLPNQGVQDAALSSGRKRTSEAQVSCGCFYKLRVLFVGVLIMRAVLFGLYIGAPDFWKLLCCEALLGWPCQRTGKRSLHKASEGGIPQVSRQNICWSASCLQGALSSPGICDCGG